MWLNPPQKNPYSPIQRPPSTPKAAESRGRVEHAPVHHLLQQRLHVEPRLLDAQWRWQPVMQPGIPVNGQPIVGIEDFPVLLGDDSGKPISKTAAATGAGPAAAAAAAAIVAEALGRPDRYPSCAKVPGATGSHVGQRDHQDGCPGVQGDRSGEAIHDRGLEGRGA